jgi:hypothetical protein
VRRSVREARKLRRQVISGAGIACVALILTALSLTHLGHGIELVTNCPAWEAWAESVGIDLGFVMLEINQMTATDRVRRSIHRWAAPTIAGTMIGSAVLNGLAFGYDATGWMILPAVAFGVAIPALIFALTKVGTRMWSN